MNIQGIVRTALADRRRLLCVYLAGWPGLALVLVIIWLDLRQSVETGGAPAVEHLAQALSPLYLAQMPLMLWTAAYMYGKSSRLRLTDALPLSARELNLSRILTGLVLLTAGGVSWLVTALFHRMSGADFSPLLMLFAALFFTCYLFASMRHVLVRAVPHLSIALFWLWEILYDPALTLGGFIWACGLLVPLTLVFGWWAWKLPPPRWTS